MVKKAKGKHRLDKFYRLAKEQGYRSRAAFKLLQLNRQFNFLQRTRTCLDLCAAPGGWMQVAVAQMPLNSMVIGIDLDPIKPVRGARSIVGDITTAKARAAIKKEANGSMMEVVLHDGAPNVGGVWASEAYSQSALVLDALKLATEFLVPNGTFVTKIFRSQDYTALLYAFKLLFNKVEATKPAASRGTSAEIFVVCMGYKAPAKIDPRLLDPRHLFKEVEEEARSMGPDALLKQKIKQKRFRDGYAEGISTMHKQTSAAAFIASEQPVEMLGQYTRFTMDGGEDPEAEGADLKELAAFVKAHPATDGEIQTLLADLQVLGRSEFKALLRWRLKLRKERALAAGKKDKAARGKVAEDAEEEESEKDEEEALLEEMQAVKDKLSQKQRREKKRKLESKRKFRLRAAQLTKGEGITQETGPDPLFSLATVNASGRAGELGDDAEVPDEDAAQLSEEEEAAAPDSGDEEYDSDEERRRYEDAQEVAMEEAYQEYRQRQGQRAKALELKQTKAVKPGDLFQPTEEELAEQVEPPPKRAKAGETTGYAPTKGLNELGESEEDDDELMPVYASSEDEDNHGLLVPYAPKNGAKKPRGGDAPPAAEDAQYQEVPMSDSDSDSGGSGMEEPDKQTAAEIRAYAKIMLQGRARNDILEAGYHRYAFHDERVPVWLADDERRHLRPPPVVTKGEVEAEKRRLEKERFKAQEAQPIKKVMEAKARKKKRLAVRLEQAKHKASSIMEQGDLSERAKAKEVAALYAKAKGSGKAPKKKPTRGDKYKNKGPPLDRRLMSDKRPVKNKIKKKDAKARTKKKGGGAKGKGEAGKKGKKSR